MARARIVGILGAAALTAACGGGASDFDLWRAREAAPGYDVNLARTVAIPEDRAPERVRRLLEMWESRPARTSSDTSGAVPVFVGTFSQDAIREALQGVEGIQVVDGGVKVGGVPFLSGDDAVSFFAAKGGKPILGVLAGSPPALDAVIAAASIPGAEPLFPDKPGMRFWRGGAWQILLGRMGGTRTVSRGMVDYSVTEAMGDAAVPRADALTREALRKLETLLGPSPEGLTKIRVLLFPDLREKYRLTGSAAASDVDFLGMSVRAVDPAAGVGFDGSEVARLMAFARFGLARSGVLENGVAQACRPLRHSDSTIGLAKGVLKWLDQVWWPGSRGSIPPRLCAELDRAIVRGIAGLPDSEPFVEVYRGKGKLPIPQTFEALSAFQLRKAIEASSSPVEDRRAAAMTHFPIVGFELRAGTAQRLAGADVGKAFSEIAATGARDVVLLSERRPGALAADAMTAGGAHDDEIEWAASLARARGLRPILQTQLLGWRRAGWVGEPFKLGEEDWDSYFRDLELALTADALLAERIGCDAWLVGSGFRGATDLPEQVERWKKILPRLRQLYGGALGYLASWQPVPRGKGALDRPKDSPPEYEIVGFWPELDFVAVSAAVPLSSWATLDTNDLRIHFGAFLDRVEKLSARGVPPIVLAELGTTATDRGYFTPWRENGAPSTAAQERASEAIAAGVESRPWVRGLLVSSWYAGHGSGDPSPELRSPASRPAEEPVRRMFSRLLGR